MADNSERVRNSKAVRQLIEEIFSKYGTDELLLELDRMGIPAGRVRGIDEVYRWEQTRSQGLMVEVEHESLGRITLPGPPLRFFSVDGIEVTKNCHSAPPLLGADNAVIAGWLSEARR